MPTTPTLDVQTTELESMDDFTLCEHLWQLVVDSFNDQDDEDDDSDPACHYPESLFAAELPEHWWIAYGVHAFEYDVLAGGLRLFLDNHNGLTNAQTAAAFRTIGHPDLAIAFARVGQIYLEFMKSRFEIGRELTSDEYEQADNDLTTTLKEAGKDFREVYQAIDLRASLASYVRKNVSRYNK